MLKTNTNSKKGFTIIEVTLVLAIAGLIMMMVFLALPALQRAQRDTQRTDDVARLITQLNQYQSNNRGKLPETASTETYTAYVTRNPDDKLQEAPTNDQSNTAWAGFYDEYLIANGDTFEDPSGGPYNLIIRTCKKDATVASGSTGSKGCDTTILSNFEDQAYTISLYLNSTCDGDLPMYSKGSRKLTAVYKKEGGGRVCQSI